jgi:hypothetical protein
MATSIIKLPTNVYERQLPEHIEHKQIEHDEAADDRRLQDQE